LDASGVSDLGPSGMTTHVNKIHYVTTITRLAEQLGEDEDCESRGSRGTS
jgi:hypothetical protein